MSGLMVLLGAAVLARAIVLRRRRQRMLELKAEYDRVIREQVARPWERADEAPEIPKVSDVLPPLDREGIRTLPPAERAQYDEEWSSLQAGFADSPAKAVAAADRLIAEVMHERNYPFGQFKQITDLVAAHHPHAASGFRSAHALARPSAADAASLEQLRQAFLHQRTLFHELLDNVQHLDLPARDARQTTPYHRWFREVDHR